VGFSVSDKTTWSVTSKAWEVVVDCDAIEFSEDERLLIINELAPVLVGHKQAKKPERQQAVIDAVAYFIRYVRCCTREIPRNALPKILSDFNVKISDNNKQAKFIELLIKWKLIYIRTDYYNPAKHGGRQCQGRARSYGIGKAMIGKFVLENKEIHTNNIDLYTVSDFLEDTINYENVDTVIAETCTPWPKSFLELPENQ